MKKPLDPEQDRMREEFNQWAARGSGASMERHHLPVTLPTIERMRLQDGDRVLDLGCGSGWATRAMAPLVAPRGEVVGVDLSDAMIREAEAQATPGARFVCAPAEHIPAPDGFFTHALSVESFYYYPDQRAVLDELLRAVAPAGRLFILICLYKENAAALPWVDQLKVPAHVRSAAEYRALLSDAGWNHVASEEFLPDPANPDPDPHRRALLLTATHPVE